MTTTTQTKTARLIADLESRRDNLRADLQVIGFDHAGRDVRVRELFQVIRKLQAIEAE